MEPKRGIDGKFHVVYKTTVIETGKFYIGKHSTRVLEDGYFGSGRLIGKFINKHGISGLKREILAYCDSVKEAFQKEKELIGDLYQLDENCMNLQPGGGGGFKDDDHQRKCATAGLNGFRKKLENPEYRASICDTFSKARFAEYAAGTRKPPGWTSIHLKNAWSDDAREKRKATFTANKHQQGEKNSQFGLIWIFNNQTKECKRISKNDEIPDGWVRGRKMKKE